jgi:hypothetical protein
MNNLTCLPVRQLARLKKIDVKLRRRHKSVVTITYSSEDDTGDDTCTVTINNKNYKIPGNVDPDQFIEEKTKTLSGAITCILYLSKKANEIYK